MKAPCNVLFPSVVSSAIAIACGNAWSAGEPTVDDLIKPSSAISVGVGAWSKDRPNLGSMDAMRKRDAYLLLDAEVRSRDDKSGTWFNLDAKNLGTENREFSIEYLQQGSLGVRLDYDEFRSRAPYTINTNHLGIGTSNQTTGTNIPNTAIGTGTNYQFGTDREKLGLSLYRSLSNRIDVNLKASSEEKKGNRISANGSGLFVADFIDWTNQKAEASLTYAGDAMRVSGGYLGSWFRNNNSAGLVALGGGATRTTQPLDNQSHQIFVSGAYDLSPTTKGNFKVAYTRGTQNDLLPTGAISSATYANIQWLNGTVDTTLVQLGLSAKPMSDLTVVANFRYHDVQDKTPQYATVRSTDNTANLAVNTTPYSYKTKTGKLEGNYRLSSIYRLTAGIDYNGQHRTVHTTINGAAYNAYVPMRAELDETTFRLQLQRSLTDSLNGSIGFHSARRTGSAYTTSTQADTATVSPVNAADRDREKVRLAIDWMPLDKMTLQANFESSRDKYGDGTRSQGLQSGRADLLSLDASYQLSDNWLVSGWYSHNVNDARFNNSSVTTNPTRNRAQNDVGSALGLNLTGAITGTTKVGAELTWSNDRTSFAQSNSNGTATGVVAPDISSRVTRLKLFANHSLQKNSELRFDLVHERWQTNDWQWTFVGGLPWQYGTATDGTSVITTPTQHSTFAAVRYIYKFQ
jgi:MtrB/PioB family decaheme-associated outer membrane protein